MWIVAARSIDSKKIPSTCGGGFGCLDGGEALGFIRQMPAADERASKTKPCVNRSSNPLFNPQASR